WYRCYPNPPIFEPCRFSQWSVAIKSKLPSCCETATTIVKKMRVSRRTSYDARFVAEITDLLSGNRRTMITPATCTKKRVEELRLASRTQPERFRDRENFEASRRGAPTTSLTTHPSPGNPTKNEDLGYRQCRAFWRGGGSHAPEHEPRSH